MGVRMGESGTINPFARRGRTIGMCSLDARGQGSMVPLSLVGKGELNGAMSSPAVRRGHPIVMCHGPLGITPIAQLLGGGRSE